MEKRRLIIPLLLLIVVFLNAQTAYASTYEVKLEEKSPGHFCFDGRDYDDYDFTVYHRFTVKKPARLYLYGDSYFRRNSYWEKDMHGNFSLYNSNKKRLFNISDYDEDLDDHGDVYSYFFVKPGTYYLRYDGYNPYKLHLKYKYFDRKISKSKKNARSIKKNKKTSGYFYRGEKNAHWYKVKLTKEQYINLTFYAYGTDRIYCYIYGKGIKNNTAYAWCYDHTYKDYYVTTNGEKLSPGTYYLKVMRKNSNISGQYTIKWK